MAHFISEKPEIVEENDHYYVRPCPLETSWQVEGEVILSAEDNVVRVAWINNAPQRSITVSTTMPYGVGLTETKIIESQSLH